MRFQRKHLLGLEDLSKDDIEYILDTAESFVEISERPIKKVPTLRGITVVNLFLEPSTRTRASFELAEKRLSADTISISASTSSTVKGESLRDTARNLEAMSIDMLVIRHRHSGAPHLLAEVLSCSVINAGDGTHEHPTQALLDLFTVRKKRGRIEGLNVAIVGDILHSRVARSNLWGFTKLGANVRLCAPATLMPPGIDRTGAQIFTDIRDAIADADVVMMLRIQTERQQECFFPSLREYSELFGLDLGKLSYAKPDVLVMHPGPLNRGVEISQEVADGSHSVILEQVKHGLAVRMAVLYLLGGGDQKGEDSNQEWKAG